MNVMLVNSLSARTKVYGAFGYGNRVGASIGTLGAVNANTGAAAAANSNVLNAGTASSNNAIVFGVAHSF
jgi:hypothetical protein